MSHPIVDRDEPPAALVEEICPKQADVIADRIAHDTTGHYTRPDLLHFEILKPVRSDAPSS